MSFIDEINKIYFVVIWVVLSMIFFFLYLNFTDNKDKINIGNASGYIFSATSILGGFRIICSRFLIDYAEETIFEMDKFYAYYGGGMVIWVSIIGIKSKLAKD